MKSKEDQISITFTISNIKKLDWTILVKNSHLRILSLPLRTLVIFIRNKIRSWIDNDTKTFIDAYCYSLIIGNSPGAIMFAKRSTDIISIIIVFIPVFFLNVPWTLYCETNFYFNHNTCIYSLYAQFFYILERTCSPIISGYWKGLWHDITYF